MENGSEGTVSAKLCCTADEAWPLLKDFFNHHKWIPWLDTCYGIEGTSGPLGCIRYCVSKPTSVDGTEEMVARWSHEKLVAIDPIERHYSFEVLDNNAGMESFVATMKLLQGDDHGCEMNFSFVATPIEGGKLDDFVSFFVFTLQAMANRMEEAIEETKQKEV